MSKSGKFAKQAVKPASKKKPSVKSALMQTYFTSLLCLVLCVSMFLGTSYAWFTSEVVNPANEIYVGTLAVDLYKEVADADNDGKPDRASLSEVVDNKNTYHLFDGGIRWEPGYTALETIQIVNEGDLTFKYELRFTDGTLAENSAAELEKVAENFEVWVYDHYNKDEPRVSQYSDISKEKGWEYAGSLDKLLADDSVLDGVMTSVLGQNGNVLSTTDRYTIALHMKENAGGNAAASAALMGQKISLNVKLIAYQMANESDDFNNANYDNMTAVASAEELKEALNKGGAVALTQDIDLSEEQITVPSGVTATLYLNGHKIFGTVKEPVSLITNNGTLTIEGGGSIEVNFTGAVDNSKAVNAIANRGILTVNGGLIKNTGSSNQIGYAIDNYNGATLTVNGGKIEASGSSYYDGIRLFCGSSNTLVTVNSGDISSVWVQNPSADKASPVVGTVIVNGGAIGAVYFENYTTVQVKSGVEITPVPYGNGSGSINAVTADGYTTYSFIQTSGTTG